jgi:predicted dehydrogenase/nucleoside-diphosphate-sugar epimerase
VTMGRTFNVAFVGCGQIARVHLAALAAVPSARLVALCDRDRDQARALAQLAPHVTLHRDLDEVLSVHRIDAVHVLTPPDAHAAIAIRAAEAGCNVLVEKPMALDRADADRMIEAAMRSGVTLVPNHNYSFKPSIERARELVLSGEIGEVVAVNGFYGIAGEQGSYGAGRSHWAWMLPGGVFTNFLPHLAYLQLAFLGGPTEVVGAALGGAPDKPTELVVQLARSEALGTMTVSIRTKPYMKFIEIYGTRGTIHADLVREVTYVHRERALPSMLAKLAHNASLVTQISAATIATSARVAMGQLPRMSDLRVLVGRFYESLESGAEPPVPAEQGREVARMLEDVRALLPARAAPPPRSPLPRVSLSPRNDVERRIRDRGALAGTALVTGGSGFLGRRVAEALVRCGVRPVLLARDPSRVTAELVDHVTIVRGDVRDPAGLAAAADGVDVLVHTAAVTTNKAPASVHEEVNVEGTRLVVAAAREAGVRRVVHASSVIVYGVDPGSPVVTENNPLDRSCRGWDHYLRTKVAAEDAARDEADGPPGPELVILRFGILYGYERPLDPGIVTIGPVRLTMGGGRNHLPFTHVDDAVNAVLLGATVDAAVGNAYNVVGDGEVTVRDAIRLVGREDGAGRRVVGVPRAVLLAGAWQLERQAARAGSTVPPRLSRFVVRSATRDISYDTGRARRELGWAPSVSLVDGRSA